MKIRQYILVVLFLSIIHVGLGSRIYAQLIYEISGNNSKNKSYLLATNRLMDIQFTDTIPNLFQYYGRCNKVITEFAMEDYEALSTLRQAALLPDSVQLRNFYTEEEYAAIDEGLQLALGMGLSQLGRMKPAYLTELYRNELLKLWLNYSEERTMETFFETVAQQTKRPIYGLDEIGETMYMLFDREPFHYQCKELKNIIEYPEKEIRQERIIRDFYRQGRLTDIAYQIEGPDNTSTISFSDYQVYAQRNRTWVKRLAPYLKEGKAFITLNAAYLGGDKGLIACLKEAGYKVKAANKGKVNR